MELKSLLLSLKNKEIQVKDALNQLSNIKNGSPQSHLFNDEGEGAHKEPINKDPSINGSMANASGIDAKDSGSPIKVYEVSPEIVVIKMEDRANKNTFSLDLMVGLSEAFDTIKSNKTYKVAILTGYENYFASGGTQDGLLAIQSGKVKYTDTNTYRLAIDCEIPVIAAMQGHGIGAGWCLGMTCDIIVMSRDSYYTTNFMKFGFTPGFGSTLIFPQKLGLPLAQEVLFTGKQYRGSELESRGVPFTFLPKDQVFSHAYQLAQTLAESPRDSLTLLKSNMVDYIRSELRSTIEKEVAMHNQTFVNKSEIEARIRNVFSQIPFTEANSGFQNKDNHQEAKGTREIPQRFFIPPMAPSDKPDMNPGEKNTVDVAPDEDPIGLVGKLLTQGIAVIGMAGKFPKATNLDEFWSNIATGRDCISEIPEDRWSIQTYYDADPRVPGKTNCKAMGHLDDVDKFDPLFFNITPNEAQLMDPQQRLFLENCWQCIEDAGVNPLSLAGSKCGVFVGCGGNDYGLLLGDQELSANRLMGGSPSILSARISYLLDLKGPCLAVETACSSSLVAISEACNALVLHTADLALAGGVCVLPGPSMHIMTTKAGMLSPEGKCFTFDDRANGFVPGEGVGVLLLKRKADAIRDGDPIYGVICGWGVNQDGKTNGITAPSVTSQTQLERDVYRRFNINPETISLVEAHGTGTKLGDPIELEALINSFSSFTKQKNYCAIGSVKSNIGHLLTAAGVAGIIKVLLAIRQQKLPPTINFNKLNEHIAIANSPFYINDSLKPWDTPKGTPRRATISSFGFSGTNAHLVIEECIGGTAANVSPINQPHQMAFPLSAKTEEQLKEQARNLHAYLVKHPDESLANIAYTLQVGRQPMNHRLVVIANSREVLLDALTHYLADKSATNIQSGVVNKRNGKPDNSRGNPNAENNRPVDSSEKLFKFCGRWIAGGSVDWDSLYTTSKPRRVHLPTYPFARESYWPPTDKNKVKTSSTISPSAVSHPLLDSDESTANKIVFKKTLRAEDYFVRDHSIRDKLLVPGMVYIEMARAATESAYKEPVSLVKDVMWARPITLHKEESKAIYIGLSDHRGMIAYEIYGIDNGEKIKFSTGKFILEGQVKNHPEQFDIDEIMSRCTTKTKQDDIYNFYNGLGITYGSSFQVTEELNSGASEVIAKLKLPVELESAFHNYTLHPSLMDGALRVLFWLDKGAGLENSGSTAPFVPFALSQVELLGALSQDCYAYARFPAGSRNENDEPLLSILNKSGKELVRIKGYTGRIFENKTQVTYQAKSARIQLYRPVLREGMPTSDKNGDGKTIVKNTSDVILILDKNENFYQEVINNVGINKRQVVLVSPGTHYQTLADNLFTINPDDQNHYDQIFSELKSRGLPPTHILHLWGLHEPLKYEAVGDDGTLEPYLRFGIFSIFYLYKAITAASLGIKTRCVFAFQADAQHPHPFHESVSGFARSTISTNHRFTMQTLRISPDTFEPSRLPYLLINDLFANSSVYAEEISYINGSRYRRTHDSIDDMNIIGNPENSILKFKGVYLIVGGLGGLGRIFAEYLANHYKANVILVGRSPLRGEAEEFVNKLVKNGSNLSYVQTNIENKSEVRVLINNIKQHFGHLNGVLQMAGIESSIPVTQADRADFDKILRPKLHGTINLDSETSEEPLDFFVMFSSISALVGDFGACSYAAANRFMDTYAELREKYRSRGLRNGKSISINWPLWKDGAMQIPDDAQSLYQNYSGMNAIGIDDGIVAFERLLTMDMPQIAVFSGDKKKIEKLLNVEAKSAQAEGMSTAPSEKSLNNPEKIASPNLHLDVVKKTEVYIKRLIAKVTKVPENRLKNESLLEEYGINSIVMMDLVSELEADFDSVPKTLFFQYPTIGEVVDYFIDKRRDQLLGVIGLRAEEIDNADHISQNMDSAVTQNFDPVVDSTEKNAGDEIAIIGMSGILPQANSVEDFWEILKTGGDCISEIPRERWDNSLYFDADKNKLGTTYCKWGGFIEDVDKFDPLFFNISPREAELMDPQERLFLETVWNLLEETGYPKDRLWQEFNGKVGMYVGVMYKHYHLTEQSKDSISGNDSSYSFIANRASYYFNLRGPSFAIDSACSSFITAIDMARMTLLSGHCQMAIAGCVNLSVHPKKYISLSQSQMLGSHRNSRSFGDGDGYLPCEAVGAVLLKPLSLAVQHNDSILGVIKMSALNHGGHTNGFAVPNPNAQAQLLEDSLNEAKINPRTISYVEAAANGSALGDPIEIAALTKAFQKFTHDEAFCAIGSVKSNIGHAEAASGFTQLVKVILQLRHKTLVPNILSIPQNPNISFKETPFFLQQGIHEWKKPVLNLNGHEEEFPRRAVISSFGAGGSNAHLLLEEYEAVKTSTSTVFSDMPLLAVFSARTEERLLAVVSQMIDFLSKNAQCSLMDAIYTLQLGREAMEQRLALIVHDKHQLIEGLAAYLEATKNNASLNTAIPMFIGNLDEDVTDVANLYTHAEWNLIFSDNATVDNNITESHLEKIASHWIRGGKVPWRKLNAHHKPRIIKLPTYPFLKKSYWLGKQSDQQVRDVNRNFHDETSESRDKTLLQNVFTDFIAGTLRIDRMQINIKKDVRQYGMNSILIVKMLREVDKHFGYKVKVAEAIKYPSINALADYLAGKLKNMKSDDSGENLKQDVATVFKSYQDKSVMDVMEKVSKGLSNVSEIKDLLGVD